MTHRQRQIADEALTRAQSGAGLTNIPSILEGFTEKGIPAEEIRPRVNVLTFQAWRALGRYVRRGEHGVRVITWIATDERRDPTTGDVTKPAGRYPWTATVFHISQTEAATSQAVA